MSLIFWDTNLFIYLIEQHPTFSPKVAAVRDRMLRRRDRLCTSALTLGEALVGPKLRNDESLAVEYRTLLRPPLVAVIPFAEETAEQYAMIRAGSSVSRSDAIQLACASTAQVDLFLTNDLRLSGKYIPGIQFIAGLDNFPL